ncbi:unnamed protein product, partial [Closterium sp. NIES-53]
CLSGCSPVPHSLPDDCCVRDWVCSTAAGTGGQVACGREGDLSICACHSCHLLPGCSLASRVTQPPFLPLPFALSVVRCVSESHSLFHVPLFLSPRKSPICPFPSHAPLPSIHHPSPPAQVDICALLARCTPLGALPLAPRSAPATRHTPHAARTDRGGGEAAWGEAWRHGVQELRAMLCSSASDTSSSDVIGPASFMWQPVACVGGAAVQGHVRDAPAGAAVLGQGPASGEGGGGEGGGGEVKGGQKEEGMGWKQRRRERQGRRKQEQRRQRCVWVWVHALMLPDALAALTAASQQMGLSCSPPMQGQESGSEQKGRRRRRVSVESREGELCRVEVAGRTALPLLLSVLRPSTPLDALSPVLLPPPFPAAAAPASASPAGRSASPAAASARLQQSEASWKVLAEHGAHLPGGAVVGFRAVDARLMAGSGKEAAGGAGSVSVAHKGDLCFDWWRDVSGSVDGGAIAAAPSLWGEEEMMGDGGEERAERRERVRGQGGGPAGTPAAMAAPPPRGPPPQHLLDVWRRALKLQGLMGAKEARRMGESVAGQWAQWQAGRGEGGSGGEGRGGGGGACGGGGEGGVVCGEQPGCDVVVVKHGCGAMQGAGVTRWSVILPSDWLEACWHPFILHGAHAIGLAERHTLFTAAGLPLFPYDYPETFSYWCHVAASYLLQRARYDRTPPSKRPLRPPVPPAWAAASGVWGGVGGGGERGGVGGDGGEGGGGEAEAVCGDGNADVELRVARCSADVLSALLPAVLRSGCGVSADGDGAFGEGAGSRGVRLDGHGTGKGGRGQAGQVGRGEGEREERGVGGAHGSQVNVAWRRVGERERGEVAWKERGAGAAGGGSVVDGEQGGDVGTGMDVDSCAACPPLPLHGLSSSAAPQRQHEQQGRCMVAVRVVPAGRGAAQAAAELCVPSPQDFHRFCSRRNGAAVHGARASAWRGVVLPPSLLRTRLGSVPGAVVRKTKRQVQKQKQGERRRGTEEQQYVASLRGKEGLQRKEGEGARGGGEWRGGTRRWIREVIGFVTSVAPRGSKSRVSLGCVRASALHAAACRQFSSAIPSLSSTSPSAALLPSLRVLLLMRCPASSAFRPVLVSLAAEDSGHLASTGWS